MGFAAGFQVGAQAVERGIKMREEDELKRNLAQESGRYNVTEGAYGPGLQENIQQLQGLREQDPTQAPAYDQAIAELTRRQGLTAPDFSVASGATNYATRQEARQAAAPMRTEGLSGVYRQAGMIDKADELENRAFEQQRAIAREARDVEADQRAKQEFATRQTVTGLEINERLRTDAERQRETDFSSYAAENPDMPVKDLKEAAFKQFKFSPTQWQKVVTTRLGIENAEMDSFKNNVKKKLQGKNLTQVGAIYNDDPDFDDKTDLAIVPGKGGAVTLNFIDKTTKAITGTQTFKNEALALEYLNKQATEPETLGSWMMSLRKTESAIEAQGAATVASNAAANLSNVRAGGLKRDAATQTKLDKIEQEFEALTPDEKVGAKGRALITSYNMASAGPGRQLSLGAAVKPEFTPKDYAITVKSFTDAGFSPADALIRADQLYGRGPSSAKEDANLQDANNKKGGGASDKKPTSEITQDQMRFKAISDTIERLRKETGLANPNRQQNANALAILEQQQAELRDSLRIGGTYNEDVGLRTMPMARP